MQFGKQETNINVSAAQAFPVIVYLPSIEEMLLSFQWPLRKKINDKSEVNNAITIVYNDLLTSLKLGSNILSLSQLFLQLSKQFLDPRQARHQIEQHFRLV